jgi:hypothetical protein
MATTNCDWWPADAKGGPRIAERSGVACDSYHRDPEDIRLLVDRDTFVRSPEPSLHWFGNVAKAIALAGVPPPAGNGV